MKSKTAGIILIVLLLGSTLVAAGFFGDLMHSMTGKVAFNIANIKKVTAKVDTSAKITAKEKFLQEATEIRGDRALAAERFLLREDCNNLFDEDRDGYADCFDADCAEECSGYFDIGWVCCLDHNARTCHYEDEFIDGMCEGEGKYPVFDPSLCWEGCENYGYDFVEVRPEDIRQNVTCYNEDCLDGNKEFNFLIVTRPMFVDTLTEFSEWKEDNGFNVGLMTVEFIMDNYEGENMAVKIKNAIHSMKELNGVEFALLIGDTLVSREGYGFLSEDNFLSSYTLAYPWNVPTMYYDRDGDLQKTKLVASDMPYSSPLNWLDPPIVNIGNVELRDYLYELKFAAEVYVGRWALKTTEELNTVIEKTINVKPIENIQMITRDGVGMGEIPPEMSETSIMNEYCEEWPPTTTLGKHYCYYNWDLLRDRVFEGKIDYDSIYVNTNEGTEAANARNIILSTSENTALIEGFHGNAEGILLGPDDFFKVEDIDDFQHAFPLMDGESCWISAFYEDISYISPPDLLGEALIKNSKGSAVYVLIPNQYYFWENLLAGKTVGESFYSGSEVYIKSTNPYVLLGDPSLILIPAGEEPIGGGPGTSTPVAQPAAKEPAQIKLSFAQRIRRLFSVRLNQKPLRT